MLMVGLGWQPSSLDTLNRLAIVRHGGSLVGLGWVGSPIDTLNCFTIVHQGGSLVGLGLGSPFDICWTSSSSQINFVHFQTVSNYIPSGKVGPQLLRSTLKHELLFRIHSQAGSHYI